jgi:hypothetical protein
MIDDTQLRLVPKTERLGYVLYCIDNCVSSDVQGWKHSGRRGHYISKAREFASWVLEQHGDTQ